LRQAEHVWRWRRNPPAFVSRAASAAMTVFPSFLRIAKWEGLAAINVLPGFGFIHTGHGCSTECEAIQQTLKDNCESQKVATFFTR
jgi:hypothetical protein